MCQVTDNTKEKLKIKKKPMERKNYASLKGHKNMNSKSDIYTIQFILTLKLIIKSDSWMHAHIPVICEGLLSMCNHAFSLLDRKPQEPSFPALHNCLDRSDV